MHHLRVLHPTDGIRAFYDGRIEGHRFADGSNWVDDGALSLGIASYAIVDGSEALIYDTHVSVEHAGVVWMAEHGVLLAGDTMEDTVTYVAEPDGLDAHLVDLERLWALAPDRILPNHGDPQIIAAGGYTKGLVRATQDYIRVLQRCRSEPQLRSTDLTELLDDSLRAGWITYFAPYEAVHRENLDAVMQHP